MVSTFKLVVDNKVQFYEIQTITEIDNSLTYRLKHFHHDLKGWEEKDQTVDFPLVKLTATQAYFSGLTIERISSDKITVYVATDDKNPNAFLTFSYSKIN